MGLEQSGQSLIPQSYWEGYIFAYITYEASLIAQLVKNLPAIQETCVQSLGWEDPLRRAWQTIPVFLPRESPQTEKPGRLQSMALQRTGYNLATKPLPHKIHKALVQ